MGKDPRKLGENEKKIHGVEMGMGPFYFIMSLYIGRISGW